MALAGLCQSVAGHAAAVGSESRPHSTPCLRFTRSPQAGLGARGRGAGACQVEASDELRAGSCTLGMRAGRQVSSDVKGTHPSFNPVPSARTENIVRGSGASGLPGPRLGSSCRGVDNGRRRHGNHKARGPELGWIKPEPRDRGGHGRMAHRRLGGNPSRSQASAPRTPQQPRASS